MPLIGRPLAPLPPVAARVDRALARMDGEVDWLLALSPIDNEAMWHSFADSGYRRMPELKYIDLEVDLDEVRQRLHALPVEDIESPLLQRLLDEPWFALPPPRSTGREQFHLDWLQERLSGEAPRDVQATLLELTVRTVVDALKREQPGTRSVLVCGGGVHNPLLMSRLQASLPGAVVESTAAHGLDPDQVEAMGFAWLARRTVAGLAGNLPAVTGARGPRVLGVVYPAAS